MKKFLPVAFLLPLIGFSLLIGEESVKVAEPIGKPIPDGDLAFTELGRYRVTGATHLQLGKATDLPKSEMVFQVFSDGIDIRICPDGEAKNYLAFQIYRDGGIYDEKGENLLPGVMALSDQGEVVRHLCVEPRILTLTKFPTLTSNLEVIYALRESE